MNNTNVDSKLISDFTSLQDKQISDVQVKMIEGLQSMGLLETPVFNLNCIPAASFQPKQMIS
ncbi:hypothetical protein R4E92_11285 [Morganella morganii]|uniref:hypothetical protein n=1 Tax=Morganella morganii TaxID=582 RepID=UPI00298D8992|nr:hypothetical protein [Morganella morganii]MDW7790976.1 hypothetical protein [Morganella morganii]